MPHRGIRWDRIARTALLLVLAGVVLLYIGPSRSWISTYGQSQDRKATVAKLRAENQRLIAQRNYLRLPGTPELAARDLGMVRGTEKAYVISGLPNR
ncbi:MAG: hypothetical protein QOF76_1366 [Solirubrobacteraceae bacterium]|jgi:hypothetical protein|nr:hypothetical protein [Solirubrobacteraceae bacterium]